MDFWKKKNLSEMTKEEWELLCDGCARCCLHKLEDEDTGEISYTCVACKYLNIDECKCISYEKRFSLFDECLSLDPHNIKKYPWLPSTCAYRLIFEGKDLPKWHPLVSGNPASVHKHGISLKNRAISETFVNLDELDAYVIDDDIF